jgi:DNA-directed RNA polymerase specialized sigma24 family protein
MQEGRDGDVAAFPPTQWSLVDRAGQRSADIGRQAMSTLLRRYLPALRAYLLFNLRLPADRVEDLLQGFVADKIVEQNLLSYAEQRKGKFRSFLRVSLRHYVVSWVRRDQAAGRRPENGQIVALPEDSGVIPAPADEPSREFNIAWARQMVAEAVARMKTECERSGRHDVWTVFDFRVVRPALDGKEPLPYGQLVAQLALKAPLQACMLLATGKRMFERTLRAVAAEHLPPGQSPDHEIDDLRRILSGRAPVS